MSNNVTPPTGLPGNDPLFGTCNGHLAFTTVDATFLQGLLPPDIELAPQTYAPEGLHPLLLMFNDTWLQSNPNLERIAKEYNLELKLHYNEFIVMLPYVQFKDAQYNDDGPWCFLPVLYLDSLLAVLGGRIFWEFNKELARFDTLGGIFNVNSEITNSPLFSTAFGLMAGQPVVGSTQPNYVDIMPILKLPVLEYGGYGYVTSVYSINYETAVITPQGTNVTNHSSKYLPPGILQIPAITQNPMGCFNMNYDWSLSYFKFIKL
jgi:hypothetical protein